MKSLLIIFGTLMLLLYIPVVIEGTRDAQTEDYDLSFAGVTTAAGVYSANVTLTTDIYDDNVLSVASVSSNVSSDSPSASAFNSSSKVLTVNGLAASSTRTLDLTLKVDNPLMPAGMSMFFGLYQWFYNFVILASFAGAIYAFVQS